MKVFRWNDENETALQEMWWQGMNPQAICEILRAVNPRAVRLKAEREGYMRAPHLEASRLTQPYQLPVFALPLIRENGAIITMENIERHECHFMMSDDVSCFSPMCGRKCRTGKSWCEHHEKIVYVKAPPVANAMTAC